MDAEYLKGFYLGDLLVEPLKGRVSGKNGERHLPPKAAEVLVCLARHAGEIVPHEKLLECAWGNGSGGRESLSHTISEIRHALDDHADNPKYIQTLPRVGYRLIVSPVAGQAHSDSIVIGSGGGSAIAELGLIENLRRRGVLETAIAYAVLGWLLIQIADVVFGQLGLPDWTGTFVTVLVIAGFPIALVLSWFLEIRDGSAIFDDISPSDHRRRRFSRTYRSVITALATAAMLVAIYDHYVGLPVAGDRGTAPPILEVADNSIAVLPFLNNDGSEETQVFANGLVDDVLTRLARVPGLLVSSRGDSSTLHPNTPSAKVRQRLRVAMYLEGSVEIRSNKIRVIVQLIDSATGHHILARTFDRPKTDFFDIRDEVTELTVSSLRVALPGHVQDLLAEPEDDPDLDVYLLYRRGIDQLNRPRTAATLATAHGWFDAALAVDPAYAAALAGKCRTYVLQFRETSNTELTELAEAACGKALQLNPSLDIVHVALGRMYVSSGLYERSEKAFLQALQINQQNVDAMIGLSEVYRFQNRPTEAEAMLDDAIGLQPGNAMILSNLGTFLYRQGRYDEAVTRYREVLLINPDSGRGLTNLASAYMMAGDFAAALSTYQLAMQKNADRLTYTNIGLANYYLGNFAEAEAALRQAIALVPEHHLSWTSLGDILFVAGKQEEARKAYEKAEQLVTDLLAVSPNDPGYHMDHAWVHAALGQKDEAVAEINAAVSAAPDDPYGYYFKGLIHERFGDSGAALDALELAVAKGYSTTMLKAEPLLSELRGNQQFVSLTNSE